MLKRVEELNGLRRRKLLRSGRLPRSAAEEVEEYSKIERRGTDERITPANHHSTNDSYVN
jgi:hypothetical protein